MSADPEAVTFPTMTPYCTRFGCACGGHVFGHAGCPVFPADLATAWAWRCADTMPDTAQGRRDSEADAKTLLTNYRSHYYGVRVGPHVGASEAAHAAFQAVPGLRP